MSDKKMLAIYEFMMVQRSRSYFLEQTGFKPGRDLDLPEVSVRSDEMVVVTCHFEASALDDEICYKFRVKFKILPTGSFHEMIILSSMPRGNGGTVHE